MSKSKYLRDKNTTLQGNKYLKNYTNKDNINPETGVNFLLIKITTT